MRNLKFEFDLFFISEAFLNEHQHNLLNTLVVPKEEFKKTVVYRMLLTIQRIKHGI